MKVQSYIWGEYEEQQKAQRDFAVSINMVIVFIYIVIDG